MENILLQVLRKHWSLVVKSINLLVGGCGETNLYCIEGVGNETKYVVRLYPANAKPRENLMRAEILFLQWLTDKGFHVISYKYPKCSTSHWISFSYNNESYVMTVYKYMHGEHLLKREEWQVRQIAATSAKLAIAAESFVKERFELLSIFESDPIDPYKMFEYLKNITVETLNYPTEIASVEQSHTVVHQILELNEFLGKQELSFPFKMETSEIPWGPVHLDMHDENVLFEDKTITGIIDWEELKLSPLVLDFSFVLGNWCTIEGHWKQDLCKIAIETYEHHRCLSEKERERLWYFILVSGQFYAYYHVVRFLEYERTTGYLVDNFVGYYELFKLGPSALDSFFKSTE